MVKWRNSINCTLCGANRICFMRETVDEEVLQQFEDERRSASLDRGELLYRPEAPAEQFYVLCTGRLKIYKLAPEGKPLITRIVQPGEVFGHEAFLAERPRQDYAEAMDDAVVAVVDRPLFRDMMQPDPAAMSAFSRLVARDLLQIESLALNLAYRSAKDRVLDVLRLLGAKAPAAAVDGTVALTVRRQDLAELSGLTIETTVRTLKEIERDGTIRLSGKEITLLD